MDNLLSQTLFFGMVISLWGYGIGLFLKKKLHSSICNPLLISVILVIVVLKGFKISYATYLEGAKYLSYLLTPATVCLAIPLYREIMLLKNNLKAILIGVTAGVIASMGSVFCMAKLFGFSHEQYVTMLPKSITTAIGMGISEEMGGITTITVAAIIITGILGNMIAETLCCVFRIQNPVAKGLAIGTSAHAIGTARAMEMGEVEGAMSSLAIVVAGLLTVIFIPVFAGLL